MKFRKIFENIRNRRSQTKAQIAMETIMIYGASLLVVTLAIGALIYFGVLDLGKLLPDKCETGSSLICENYLVDSIDGVKIEIRNKLGRNIGILDVEIVGVDDWEGLIDCSGSYVGDALRNGDLGVISMDATACGVDTQLDQKIKAKLTLRYQVAGSSITQTEVGELQATVS